MASGSYARKKPIPRQPVHTQSFVPARATRQLQSVAIEEESETGILPGRPTISKALQVALPASKPSKPFRPGFIPFNRIVDEYAPDPLQRHKPWLNRLTISISIAVVFALVLLSAGMFQRTGDAQLISYFGGKAYDVQSASWQMNGPMSPKVPIPTNAGPYSVLGKPSISVNFINQVLASYHSPASGKGQTLYDLGMKYGIDPAFALAFFMHESTFGTAGEARVSLSLGNLRCIPNYLCRDGYAWFSSWESGFEAWYRLIRNLYVAQWGLTTVEQIIPRYAPTADNNNEAAYIASLKHSLDTWHAGILRP